VWWLGLLLACGPRARPLPALAPGGCPEPPVVPFDEEHVESWVSAARSARPELAGHSIVLRPSGSSTVFFRADVTPGSVFRRADRRVHRVHYSRRLFDDPPPPEAVMAILDHELEHVRHYTELGGLRLVGFGLDYAVGGAARYERGTDAHPVALGCAEGLAAYRRWLYARLSPRQERRKRRLYLTPEELSPR
jgi:hypothetical protein